MTKAKVITKRLAFWESLIDVCGEPTKYLKAGEAVTIVGEAQTSYAGIFGDKEYYKIQHHVYGRGYVRKEGLEFKQQLQGGE